MTEIDLIVNGKNIREFEMDCVPRNGEKLDIDFDQYKGVCVVIDVIHIVFTEKDSRSRVRNYVKVFATM